MPAVPMFAIPGSDQLAAFAVKCLAVAGGFLAGYVIGGTAAWALDRWVFAQKSPDFVKKSIRVVAGIALAVLIALIVFGEGGGGLFGGGGGAGQGEGKGTPSSTDDGRKAEQPKPPELKQPKVDVRNTPDIRPEDPRVRVTFLGGDAVQGNRFYLVDDDPSPKTFAELKAILLTRKKESSRPLFLLVLFPTNPKQRIDENSINVTQVTTWARNEAGVEVVWPGKK